MRAHIQTDTLIATRIAINITTSLRLSILSVMRRAGMELDIQIEMEIGINLDIIGNENRNGNNPMGM